MLMQFITNNINFITPPQNPQKPKNRQQVQQIVKFLKAENNLGNYLVTPDKLGNGESLKQQMVSIVKGKEGASPVGGLGRDAA